MSRVPPTLLAVLALGVATAGCTRLRSHQGYIVDADLVNSVQPGVDNRQSVLATLGNPTIVGQFGDSDWYYLARDSRNYGFSKPRPADQVTLRISFDAAGNVAAVRRSGVEQVASISPDRDTTPTLGKKSNFFNDLFGNIGTVGAPGGGGSGQTPGR